jgi:hypothetical protein
MAQNIPTDPHPPRLRISVRGWLRRLRAHAGPLRSYAMGELAWLGGSTGIMPAAAASALGDALNAVATAAHAAIRKLALAPDLTWPLIGRLGLARYLAPAPAG